MSDQSRLELALERLKHDQWSVFERYASAFFSSEFPSIRTMASPSGDDGRDAELFSPDGKPSVALQYSVTEHWKKKIRATAKRLKETGQQYSLLIYATSQQVGADGDDLKTELLDDYSLVLDIRDRSYFLERFRSDNSREALSKELSAAIVDPFLESRNVIERRAQALTPGESRAALVFLEMQLADESKEKGLTRIVFEALVRAALRNTDSENRMPLAAVYKSVAEMVPQHNLDFVTRQVDRALRRLDKGAIRTWQKELEYCLSNEEVEKTREKALQIAVQDEKLNDEIFAEMERLLGEGHDLLRSVQSVQQAVKFAIERFLMRRGELFVGAISDGEISPPNAEDLGGICREELEKVMPGGARDDATLKSFRQLVEQILRLPTDGVAGYLRRLSEAYTLRAFLRQTPDVQEAVRKMFSFGEIWLDSSVVLPLLAENLLPNAQRRFQKLITAAGNAGLSLRVTSGVIEEVERHLNRAKVCAGTPANAWHGFVPYVLAVYVSRGMDLAYFNEWVLNFCGEYRAEDDIAEYVERDFGIKLSDISEDASRASGDLAAAVKDVWQDIHVARREHVDGDQMIALRMASHDAENYLGVLVRRKHNSEGAIGFSSWWLSLDQKAFSVASRVEDYGIHRFPSPVMSADFLANYLAIGPLRSKSDGGEAMAINFDLNLTSYMDAELFELAKDIRRRHAGLPEYRLQRLVRDELDKARSRTGRVTSQGLRYEDADVG